MPNHWSLAEGRWNIPWPQRVSQHDLVYLSPPDDPLQGLPVGNGDLGALVWVEGSQVFLAINKVDTWDDGPDANFHNWGASEEDGQTTLRFVNARALFMPTWPIGYYGIPDGELAPVFPAGALGLKDRGSEHFRAMVTPIRLHLFGEHSLPHPHQGSGTGTGGFCMGWCPVPIVCARLGLKEETVDALRDHIQSWQPYPQGFGHYGPHAINQRDKHQYYHTHQVRDASVPDLTLPFAGWNFRHFSNEAMPIVSTAINEMLLQSQEGVIRLCPAVPDDWEVAFTLLARGGFKVSSQQQGGRISWVWIESRLGNKLSLDNPWPDAARIFVWPREPGAELATNPSQTLTPVPGAAIAWETRRGWSYLVGCDPNLVSDWQETTLTVTTNDHSKTLGVARLGKERQF